MFPKEKIDAFIECSQENCPHCGSDSLQESSLLPKILQQVELPEIKAITTEYSLAKYSCHSCGKGSTAPPPEGIPSSAFGPNLMGLFATLTGVYHIARREAIQLIKDLYDVDVGLGSASNIEERVTNALDPVYQRIHSFVIYGKFCKYFDETSWRNSGKRHFVWLASCEHAAVYMIDPSRSLKAFHKLIGEAEIELAVSDRYAVYNKIKNFHQYCLAHLVRDFRGYAERDGPDKETAKSVEKLLARACWIHGKYRDEKIIPICKNKPTNKNLISLSLSFFGKGENNERSKSKIASRVI